jgi:hypothetical protein
LTPAAIPPEANVPPKPPLPLPWNTPFHPSLGSHISISISESGAGFTEASTLQNAGMFAYFNLSDAV